MDTAVFGDTVPLINVASSLASTRAETTILSESHQFQMTRSVDERDHLWAGVRWRPHPRGDPPSRMSPQPLDGTEDPEVEV